MMRLRLCGNRERTSDTFRVATLCHQSTAIKRCSDMPVTTEQLEEAIKTKIDGEIEHVVSQIELSSPCIGLLHLI